MIKYIIPYSSIKFHHYSASLGKSLQEDNSEDDTFHVQASGFRDTKFPLVIFRPKKRSGIIVRVGEKGPGLSKRSDLRRIGQNQKDK